MVAWVRCLAVLAFAGLAGSVGAQGMRDAAPLVVRNDPGGLLTTRLTQIRQLASSGRPVRIEGRYCYSTCTMLITLPGACVDPETVFGFHGPSRFGAPLTPEEFENASRVIAAHYPAPLRDWYLREGRMTISGFYRISGAELIRLGVRAC